MSKWVVDIHGDIEGDYEIIKEYEEPKTGHWIEMPIGFRCSNCNELENKTTKYCSNCGAKMIEPQESEEISDRNMKMWEEIFKAEREGKE